LQRKQQQQHGANNVGPKGANEAQEKEKSIEIECKSPVNMYRYTAHAQAQAQIQAKSTARRSQRGAAINKQ